MKIKYKLAILVALLGVISACSSESTPTYSDLGSDTYPQKFYVEYVPCTGGPDYSPGAGHRAQRAVAAHRRSRPAAASARAEARAGATWHTSASQR